MGQIALMVLVFFGPRTIERIPPWPEFSRTPLRILGVLLVASGLALLVAGAFRLGPNLTPLPYPREGAAFHDTGAFGIVRHPMYGGGVGIALGWAMAVHGWLTLVYAVILIVLLDVKADREERWLVQVYPGYRDYQERVPKLLPFLRRRIHHG